MSENRGKAAGKLSDGIGREEGRDRALGGVENEDRDAPLRAEEAGRVGRADVTAADGPEIDAAQTTRPEAPGDGAEQESGDDEQRVERNLGTLPDA